jgi:outer membrane protein assembly factor BamB
MSARVLTILAAVLVLSSCGDNELILPGEREAVRPVEVSALQEGAPIPGLNVPAASRSASWPQVSGNAQHLSTNLALNPSLTRVWSVNIGKGNSKRGRIISSPIVAGGTIFTMDASATVSAVSTEGRVLWQTDATASGEASKDGFGGGLAFDNGRLFVTTAFGEVLALDPSTGGVIWRTAVDAAIRAAPVVEGGRVVVVARNDIGYGLDAQTGALDWRAQGVGLGAGVLGGSSPAIRGPVTVIPYQSGEVNAVLTRNGRTVWNAAISGGRRELVRSQISDITGDPVIDGDIVYAANQGGLLVKFDRRNGDRLWTARQGSLSPALPMDNSVFIVSDEWELLRLSKETGDEFWSVQLPQWQKPEDRRDAYPHFGPIMGNGRLIVAGSDGLLRSFNPVNGTPLGSVEIPGGAAALPAVANGTMYVVSLDGRLHAYR